MKFSIRDVLWLTVVIALGVGWWLEHRLHLDTAAQVRALETKTATQSKQLEFLNSKW